MNKNILEVKNLNIAGKQQNPIFDTIKKIAKALNVSIEDLIK